MQGTALTSQLPLGYALEMLTAITTVTALELGLDSSKSHVYEVPHGIFPNLHIGISNRLITTDYLRNPETKQQRLILFSAKVKNDSQRTDNRGRLGVADR